MSLSERQTQFLHPWKVSTDVQIERYVPPRLDSRAKQIDYARYHIDHLLKHQDLTGLGKSTRQLTETDIEHAAMDLGQQEKPVLQIVGPDIVATEQIAIELSSIYSRRRIRHERVSITDLDYSDWEGLFRTTLIGMSKGTLSKLVLHGRTALEPDAQWKHASAKFDVRGIVMDPKSILDEIFFGSGFTSHQNLLGCVALLPGFDPTIVGIIAKNVLRWKTPTKGYFNLAWELAEVTQMAPWDMNQSAYVLHPTLRAIALIEIKKKHPRMYQATLNFLSKLLDSPYPEPQLPFNSVQ